jgi:hypothetical protein
MVLTEDLAAGLPDVTAAWAGFDGSVSLTSGGGLPDAMPQGEASKQPTPDRAAVEEDVRQQWREGMVASRVEPLRHFIDSIGTDDPQPTFYFLHTLVTHHPYYMLPGDKQNKTWVGVPGKQGGAWSKEDPWAIAQQYQRHLLQVGFIDGMLGQLVRRLKDMDLYDRSLLVITSDHGISFVPGVAQRNFVAENAAEIMRVPIIFKFPRTAGVQPRIDDRNAETIDIVPTIADALGLEMAWKADGRSLLDDSQPARATKAIFSGATGSKRTLQATEPDLQRALSRKLELFGDGTANVHRAPLTEFDKLVGQPLTALRIADGGGAVEILHPWDYEDVDPAAPAVPFDVAGRFGSPFPDTVLAVAVNGVVEAVTRTWKVNPRGWLATPRLDAWRPGPNEIEVLIVDKDASGSVLRRTVQGEQRPPDLNLITDAASRDWGVRQWGFYGVETVNDGRQFRWTRDRAEISNAFTHRRPRAVEIEILQVPGGTPKRLRIDANDCTLFDGEVGRNWASTLSLESCGSLSAGLTLKFETTAPRGQRDRRRLGVAISRVVLK